MDGVVQDGGKLIIYFVYSHLFVFKGYLYFSDVLVSGVRMLQLNIILVNQNKIVQLFLVVSIHEIIDCGKFLQRLTHA